MRIKCCKTVFVLLECFIQYEVLNPAIFNNSFRAINETMLVNFQNIFCIVRLLVKSNGKNVSGFKFQKDSVDHVARERQTITEKISSLRALAAEHFDNFHSQCFVRVAKLHILPFGRCTAVKFCGDLVGKTASVQFTQVIDLFSTVH